MTKSLTRDVLSLTSASRSSYSSGSLDVGDLVELAIDFNVTAVSGTGDYLFQISRIGTDGILYPIVNLPYPQGSFTSANKVSGSLGAGLATDGSNSNGNYPAAFGDSIQVDLVLQGLTSITFSGSIKGK